MTTGFHHTSFTVSDVAAATRFFVELLGLEQLGGGRVAHENLATMVGADGAVLEMAYLAFPERAGVRPGHLLELIEYVEPAGAPTDTATNRPGNAHLSFQVSDIHAAY